MTTDAKDFFSLNAYWLFVSPGLWNGPSNIFPILKIGFCLTIQLEELLVYTLDTSPMYTYVLQILPVFGLHINYLTVSLEK